MAGAFRRKNADKIFKRLSKLGYKAKRIEANKYGLYPVLYGSYATYAEADKAKKRNSENGQSEAWLLIESL
jgi:cell division protein FtsN